jgi:hypothetical protein
MRTNFLTWCFARCLYWAVVGCLGVQGTSVLADMLPSASISNGIFLGHANEVFLSQPQAARDVAEIRAVCARRGRLWVLGTAQKFECESAKGFEYPDGDVLKLQIHGPRSVSANGHAALYSVRPFAPPSWTVRQLLGSDTSALHDEILQKFKKYSIVLRKQNLKNSTVIESKKSPSRFYILPWKTADNGYFERKHFIIATVLDSRITSVREHEGKIVGYADIDGDSIPELHLLHNCDGVCESVISMTRKIKYATIVTFSVH